MYIIISSNQPCQCVSLRLLKIIKIKKHVVKGTDAIEYLQSTVIHIIDIMSLV